MEEICKQTKAGLLNGDIWVIVGMACENIPDLPKKPLWKRTYKSMKYGECTIKEGTTPHITNGVVRVWNVYNEDKELVDFIPYSEDIEEIADAIEHL